MNEFKIIINEQLQQLQMLMHRCAFSNFRKMHNPHRGQGRVLAILKLKPIISQKELTYLLNMSKQSVAELIAKLEKSGYITREPSEDDKRIMTIKLTEEGAKATDDTDDNSTETLKILDCLNEEELANFSEYLSRIIKQYEEQFPDEDFEQRRKYMEKFMSAYGHGFEHWENAGHGFRGFGHSFNHGFKEHGRNHTGMGQSPFRNGGMLNDDDDE